MRSPRVSWKHAAVAAACLAGGYADLALGGTTLSAILLVAGYCVAVPVAVLAEARRRSG